MVALVTLQAPHHHKETMVAMVFLFPRVEQVPGVVVVEPQRPELTQQIVKVEQVVQEQHHLYQDHL
jgi:hypothetical protein